MTDDEAKGVLRGELGTDLGCLIGAVVIDNEDFVGFWVKSGVDMVRRGRVWLRGIYNRWATRVVARIGPERLAYGGLLTPHHRGFPQDFSVTCASSCLMRQETNMVSSG